jgi:acetoin utilization protein AcuC
MGLAATLIAPTVRAVSPASPGLIVGDVLGRYGFPSGHPLGIDRQAAFLAHARALGLDRRVDLLPDGGAATDQELARFHTQDHIARVRNAERAGLKYLDAGSTPVFQGIHEIAATVVGAALRGVDAIMRGRQRRVFQPIGGFHHAARGHASGFCVYNDVGVVIETLRTVHGVRRVGYVDIDVHHGDGVYDAFEDDPDVIIADVHESGEHLFPGTGRADQTGRGTAAGTKLNLPLEPGAGDAEFFEVWPRVLAHLERYRPEVVLFQCGADGLLGDPLADLRYSPAVHESATTSLVALAGRLCGGRLMAFGGGGYDRDNLARAWAAVLQALCE